MFYGVLLAGGPVLTSPSPSALHLSLPTLGRLSDLLCVTQPGGNAEFSGTSSWPEEAWFPFSVTCTPDHPDFNFFESSFWGCQD